MSKARDNLRVNPNDYQEYFYYDAYQCGKWQDAYELPYFQKNGKSMESICFP